MFDFPVMIEYLREYPFQHVQTGGLSTFLICIMAYKWKDKNIFKIKIIHLVKIGYESDINYK